MIVGDFTGPILLEAALITVDGIREKKARAIHRQQIMIAQLSVGFQLHPSYKERCIMFAIMIAQLSVGFQHLAPLKGGKDRLEGRTKRVRLHLIDDLAHLRIARHLSHPIQRTQIVGFGRIATLPIKL